MDEPKEGMSTNHGKKLLNPFAVKKPKKRSLVERELETNMTARVTSPVTMVDGASTSRYGRARRIKTGCDDRVLEFLKSSKLENISAKPQPLTKQVESSYKTETPKKTLQTSMDNTDISQDNRTPCSTNKEELPKSKSAKTLSKVYIRKDLIQNRDDDDDIILIKDLFSPKSGRKRKVIKSSSEKQNLTLNKNLHIENASVVKALDFDSNKNDSIGNKHDSVGNKHDSVGNKKSNTTGIKRNLDGHKSDSANNKNESTGNKNKFDSNKQDSICNKQDSISNNQDSISNKQDSDSNKQVPKKKKKDLHSVFKNQLSALEESSPYQAGDLAWARMGTFPFWPCIITRDPESDMFVRKKLFGRIEHYILHVTFFADNGRRSWVVDNMLRKYMGLKEFLSTRGKFTNEDKKNNPRLYSAFFISEKKQSLWNTSVAEAETIERVPRALRIDVFNDMLYRVRASKKQLKSGKITRTDSDVSLSESLFDSLFSEDDVKTDDLNRQKNRTRNKSLDVSDVVTACLDNMAAITGNIKIQKQSHMDRWLQKAKSKTPEKVKTEQEAPKTPVIVPKIEIVTPNKVTPDVGKIAPARIAKPVSNNKKKKLPPKEVKITKVYSLRRSYEPQSAVMNQSENETSQSKNNIKVVEQKSDSKDENKDVTSNDIQQDRLNDIIVPLKDNTNKNSDEDSDDILNAINELLEDSSATSGNNKICKSRDTVEDSNKEITENLADRTNNDLKPVAMDVDEPKIDVENKDKSDVPEVICDSPIKIEKESTNLVSDCTPILIDCDSPVKTERESTETVQETNGTITKNNVSNGTINEISAMFKRNEMVSIPENLDMTDDDSNFMTIENDDIQDHNSKLTNVSAKAKTDTEDVAMTEVDNSRIEDKDKFIEVNPIIKPVESNTSKEKLYANTEDVIPKNIGDSCVEIAPFENLVESNISSEKHDMTIEKIDKNTIKVIDVTTNEMGSSCAKIHPITELLESNVSTEKVDNMFIEKLDTNTVGVISKEMGSSFPKVNPIKEQLESNVSTERYDMFIEKFDTNTVGVTLKETGSSCDEMNTIKEPVEADISTNKHDQVEKFETSTDKTDLLNEQHDMSIDEFEGEEVTMNEKNLLNESGQSASILQIDDELNDFVKRSAAEISNGSVKSESIFEPCTNVNKEVSSVEIKPNEITPLSNNNESDIFLGESHNIDLYKDVHENKDTYFREVNTGEPPDLTAENSSAKANLLQNDHDEDSDIDEDSDDEPSPEYEPLGDEITEDFRQHMKCIESNITDKKDDAQLVKVCNEIAIIEESKGKLADIKISTMDKISPNVSVLNNGINSSTVNQEVVKEENIKIKSEELMFEKVVCDKDNKINLTKTFDNDITKDTKNNILDGLNIINNVLENNLKFPSDNNYHNDISKDTKKTIVDGLIMNQAIENNLKSLFDKNNFSDLTKNTKSNDITNYEVLDGLNIIQKAVENNLKSPRDKKKHKLSLKRNTSKYEIDTKQSTFGDNTFNPRYKTIDQIEEIMKSKPTRLPIENGEVQIPEIKENGYHRANDTPDRYDDDDFDIDKVSVNSEDSEVSLPQERVPARRSLRTKPKRGGLEDPEFLAYMELRQDDLMEQHPELSIDDIVLYLYKTYAYAQKIEADAIEETEIVKSIKQETPTPPQKKSKKPTQPKNTIENFFRVKYKNAVDSERTAESSERNEDVKPKKETLSISPVDSGIGSSKDSNESETPVAKRKTKSPQSDIKKEVKVERINDVKHKSPKTPKRHNKIMPRVLGSTVSITPNYLEEAMNKRGPFVVISPIKDGRIGMILKRGSVTKPKFDIDTKPEIVKHEVITKTENETVIETILAPVVKTKRESVTELKHEPVTKPKQEVVTESTKKMVTDMEYEVIENTHELVTEIKEIPVTKTNDEPVIKTKEELETNHESVNETDRDLVIEMNHEPAIIKKHESPIGTKCEKNTETESIDSDSELPLRQLRTKVLKENQLIELKKELLDLRDGIDDTASASSENEPLLKLKPKKVDKNIEGSYEDPEFLTYFEVKQEHIMDENPQLSQNEIKAYLYKTWIYEKDAKSDIRKVDDIQSSNLVKGSNQESVPVKKARRKPKTEKNIEFKVDEVIPKDKPKRKTVSHYYNEAFLSDIEDELEVFEIFKTKKAPITVVSKPDSPKKETTTDTKPEEEQKPENENVSEEINTLDEIELYFKQLTSPKPSVFKGLIREKVCEICEDIANLIKCKSCHGTFHYDCVNRVVEIVETPTVSKGRKRKKRSKKQMNLEDSYHSDEQDASAEISAEDIPESITIDAETLESQLEAKMKELLDKESQFDYDSYSSGDEIDWTETLPGKCELIDVKLKKRPAPIDYANFKCNNCQEHNTPICFVCRSAVSKTDVKIRQRCNVAHCHSYYHVECLDHWPQTQFNAGDVSRSYKNTSGRLESLTCPRHVCHTCVSDDPRGCKTRFSGDKLAKCVRCPATYHSFNKCLPAGTQILTASLIICPRHYEHRPGKVPCHVNTGWCFICALGGSLICCEYCPTSFHAECLNIKPPEGNYMCEDCETGRLPLYGEMVWVKLGHYRWWPGVILHPSEIPDNIMAVKHGLGEFVVRFFGQYDHYWVNRGRVFPYQEGDSGRISSQKSKIDVAFTTAMEHAQRAFEILKNAVPDEEESLEIASSLLPPHYVKLKCNKPIGSLLGRKVEDPSLSLTQCECNPAECEPCGPNTQCINRYNTQCINRMLLTECGPTCRAGDRCSNRAFEKRLYPKLTPYKATNRGWGLKTLEDIKAGQFVIEYVGELIDEEEFQRRMTRMHEIRDENFYFLTLDKERMIDAGPKGNLARFMNHCCEPNCETQKWTVLGDIRVGLFAINDIKANSEVTFNYNLECTGIEKKRCLCGAKRCSGYIGAKPKQLVDESQRKKNGTLTGKRKYIKRKNIEVNPATVKKVKRPLGRPPKPKPDLTEIQKDLLIIKSATIATSEESRSQSIEENNLKPLKKKTDSNSTDEVTISSAETTDTRESIDSKTQIKIIHNGIDQVDSKLNLNIKQEDTILNSTEISKTLKRKLDLIPTEEVTILSEPSAKRQKCDKIEVGD